MTTLGVFRDDFYNPTGVLPMLQFKTTSQASGTLVATSIAGATECYVSSSGATALTTDTAANIIAQLQNAIAVAIASASVPSVQGLTYTLYVRNTNAGTLTITGGTGVTITGTATLATTVERQFLVTISSPTTVSLQDLGGGLTQ